MSSYYCRFEDCKTQSTYGIKNTKKRLYCVKHKEIDHVNVTNKTCLKCDKRPSYGIKGTKLSLYCSKHKEVDHVLVKSKTCLECDKQPAYGIRGTKALYCVDHKQEDHVNVKSKTCLDCEKQPVYGIKGTKVALYCVEHKAIDHVNVKNKTCLSCDKRPAYGVRGTKVALYCVEHKEIDHVDVKSKTCLECEKQPGYGIKGTKVALYCVDHKEIDHVDVKHKLCEYTNCSTRAHFGPLFKLKIHCAKHKTNNEFSKNNPNCEFEKCKLQPCYTNENNNYPLRCENHKNEDDKNIVERNCSSCNLICMLTNDNLCNDCNEYITRQPHKRKEIIIKNVLDANKLEYDTYDKIPTEACNKYRPDFVFDRGTYVIILEVDENQHQSYACECEQARMINLFQDFGGLPVVFVRFNPDGYTDNNGKRHQYTKSRETRLLKTLTSLILHQPKEFLSVIYLYYNGDDGVNKTFEIDYDNNTSNIIKDEY